MPGEQKPSKLKSDRRFPNQIEDPRMKRAFSDFPPPFRAALFVLRVKLVTRGDATGGGGAPRLKAAPGFTQLYFPRVSSNAADWL